MAFLGVGVGIILYAVVIIRNYFKAAIYGCGCYPLNALYVNICMVQDLILMMELLHKRPVSMHV